MERMFPVKEEYSGESSFSGEAAAVAAPPRPVEGLHDMGPPPFLTKTFDMVDDLSIDHIVSWNRAGQSFVVWDLHAFSTCVLPKYFKHNNFSSFVRQLNTYGFRKIDPDKWEFANEAFLKGQKHLLRNIRRRKTTNTLQVQALPSQRAVGPCVEVGRFVLDAEIDSLRRDKQVLFMELVKLRQQQMNTRAYLQQMEMRLQGTERKQQQMMSFLARAMQNPEFIHQLVQQKEKRKEIKDVMTKKRRRPIKDGESSRGDQVGNLVKIERLDGFQVSELEALALEMQGIGSAKQEDLDGVERDGIYDKELEDGFWEELLNEGFDEVGLGEDGGEDVNVLVERLGILGSSPK